MYNIVYFFFGILVIIILLVQMSFSDCKLEEKNTLQNFPPCSLEFNTA